MMYVARVTEEFLHFYVRFKYRANKEFSKLFSLKIGEQ